MSALFAAYLPMDRRHALADGRALPEHTHGAALFADISGFTPLTLGPRVLRTETAPVVALTLLQHHFGDL